MKILHGVDEKKDIYIFTILFHGETWVIMQIILWLVISFLLSMAVYNYFMIYFV